LQGTSYTKIYDVNTKYDPAIISLLGSPQGSPWRGAVCWESL
jgi:hypothetical protein